MFAPLKHFWVYVVVVAWCVVFLVVGISQLLRRLKPPVPDYRDRDDWPPSFPNVRPHSYAEDTSLSGAPCCVECGGGPLHPVHVGQTPPPPPNVTTFVVPWDDIKDGNRVTRYESFAVLSEWGGKTHTVHHLGTFDNRGSAASMADARLAMIRESPKLAASLARGLPPGWCLAGNVPVREVHQ